MTGWNKTRLVSQIKREIRSRSSRCRRHLIRSAPGKRPPTLSCRRGWRCRDPREIGWRWWGAEELKNRHGWRWALMSFQTPEAFELVSLPVKPPQRLPQCCSLIQPHPPRLTVLLAVKAAPSGKTSQGSVTGLSSVSRYGTLTIPWVLAKSCIRFEL